MEIEVAASSPSRDGVFPVRTSALVRGVWARHAPLDGARVMVTHVPTGRRLAAYATQEEAEAAVCRLWDAGLGHWAEGAAFGSFSSVADYADGGDFDRLRSAAGR